MGIPINDRYIMISKVSSRFESSLPAMAIKVKDNIAAIMKTVAL